MRSTKLGLEYDLDRQILIGERIKRYQDLDTGEIIDVNQVSKRKKKQKNFWKCYLMDFLAILGVFDNKQVDVFIYIVENTNQSNNVFLGTYKKIAKDVGVTTVTIARIMKKLKKHNFIKLIQNGAYLVNPNILMKGSDKKRHQLLLSYYRSEDPLDNTTKIKTSRDKQQATSNIYDEQQPLQPLYSKEETAGQQKKQED